MPKAIITHLGALLFFISVLSAGEDQAAPEKNVMPTESQADAAIDDTDKGFNTIIPESSTAALIGLAGLALIFRRRL